MPTLALIGVVATVLLLIALRDLRVLRKTTESLRQKSDKLEKDVRKILLHSGIQDTTHGMLQLEQLSKQKNEKE
jgi:hypothetical protein